MWVKFSPNLWVKSPCLTLFSLGKLSRQMRSRQRKSVAQGHKTHSSFKTPRWTSLHEGKLGQEKIRTISQTFTFCEAETYMRRQATTDFSRRNSIVTTLYDKSLSLWPQGVVLTKRSEILGGCCQGHVLVIVHLSLTVPFYPAPLSSKPIYLTLPLTISRCKT